MTEMGEDKYTNNRDDHRIKMTRKLITHLVWALAISFIIAGCAGIVEGSAVSEYSGPEISSGIETGTRASDIVNYTQMALDFIQENYPNRTLRILTLYEENIPYVETGYVYTDIKVEITPGNSSPHDTVIVTIRHDTQNMEFGDSQYQMDYDEYYSALPLYYKKMGSYFRVMIREQFGYMPYISDSASESYSTNFTIHYTQENQTKVVSYLREARVNYSVVKIEYNNETYIVSNMSLKNCLLTANQSFVQSVGINIQLNWELNVVDSWHYDSEDKIGTDFLVGIIIVIIIIGALALYCLKKNNRLKSEKNKRGENDV